MSEQDVSIRWRIIRRGFHAALSIVVIYYWLPDFIIELNAGKWALLLICGLAVACIETPRLLLRKRLPWNRPYELQRPASYAYAALGAILVLLFFPPIIGAPAIVAMAWADPVAGELRRRKLSRARVGIVCGAVYAAIAFPLTMAILPDYWLALSTVFAMTITAVISEDLDLKYLDDDFTMIVLPAIVGLVVYLLS